jgi:enoyl-CoA hydratase/carnithine racemase
VSATRTASRTGLRAGQARGARRGPRLRVLTLAHGVAWLTLPADRIDEAAAQALCDAVERIAFDESVRVAVVQGGSTRFCLGVTDDGAWQERFDWVAAVAALTVPVVAAIAGDAIGEGAELALACDLPIASARAAFAFPHVIEGRLPRHGATQRLPRAAGRLRALDLLLSGRRVGAREAARIGLVSQVVVPGRLGAAVRATVDALRAKGPLALRLAKEAVRAGADLTLDQGIRLEQDLYVLLQTTADRREGVRAFLARRRPTFRGR